MKTVVNYNDPRWKNYKIDFSKIANAAAGAAHKTSEVSIILTNDSEIHDLNKEYRGFDKPTNVLSFETGDDRLLGDIFVSFDTVMKESKGDNKTFEDHASHMVVHGVLHLLGHDHIDDYDAVQMESLEIKVLNKLAIKNPYSDQENTKVANKSFWDNFTVKENSWAQYVLYFALGGISAFGYAPFNLWWATLIGIGGAYYLTIRNLQSGNKNRFWKSVLQIMPFGAAYAVGMFWWVVNSIFVVPELAEEFAIFTIPSILGIGLFGGFIFAIPFVLIRCIRPNPACRPILFALFWTIILWLREWLFTGFPWNPIANISMSFPIISNSMSLWGALGLTFIIIGLIASIAEVIKNRKTKYSRSIFITFITFILLILVGMFFGYKNIQKSVYNVNENIPVIRIVQPAGSAEDKATHSREQAIANAERNIQNLIRLATENPTRPDLYVFPETSYPYMIVDDSFPLSQILGAPVVIGATSYNNGKVYNSLVIGNEQGRADFIYSKSHLVPFGEYRPFGDIIPTPGQLTPGDGAEILQVNVGGKGTVNFAPAICYEIVFSDSLVPHKTLVKPDIIINITNDTWFGKTPGSYQHLDMVRRYAIESGLPIVRSNYSGISAFINADGTVVSQLSIGVAGHLDGQVGGDHMTIYRTLGRDLWMVIILLFSVIFAKSISVFQKKD
ncbi:MAG: apolipoprotein N-acyltransferase [Rickettsiales bacterium]|jgi:apolipoprotein N-acyltransferase|nr:apolipoprotein N-acyltransferase [Rickettsiales bacterium]